MTRNQISYWELKERSRSNRENERLTAEKQDNERAYQQGTLDVNRANTQETIRHNKAYEAETARSNKRREQETERHNLNTERETMRSNFAQEGLQREKNMHQWMTLPATYISSTGTAMRGAASLAGLK